MEGDFYLAFQSLEYKEKMELTAEWDAYAIRCMGANTRLDGVGPEKIASRVLQVLNADNENKYFSAIPDVSVSSAVDRVVRASIRRIVLEAVIRKSPNLTKNKVMEALDRRMNELNQELSEIEEARRILATESVGELLGDEQNKSTLVLKVLAQIVGDENE